MKKMNKKGFTLIELLAVIVILAIVAAVTMTVVVPMISGKDEEGAIASVSNMRQQIVNACSGLGVSGIDGVEKRVEIGFGVNVFLTVGTEQNVFSFC